MDERNYNKNLDLLRIVYGASFSLGFFELGEMFNSSLFDNFEDEAAIAGLFPLLVGCTLMLLAIRFFWAVGNIRHYIDFQIDLINAKIGMTFGNVEDDQEQRQKLYNKFEKNLGRKVMLIHVPLLMLHSFIFFLLCKIMSDFQQSGNRLDDLFHFVILYISVLVMNSAWLYFIGDQNDMFVPGAGSHHFWMYNNFITAIMALIVLQISFADPFHNFYSVIALFVASSLLDLYKRGHLYIFHGPG